MGWTSLRLRLDFELFGKGFKKGKPFPLKMGEMMRGSISCRCRNVLLSLLLLLLAAQVVTEAAKIPASALPELTRSSYADIVGRPKEQVVVFYLRSKGAKQVDAALEMVRRVLYAVDKNPSLLRSADPSRDGSNFLQWRSCDGEDASNAAGFKEAQFSEPAYVFTSTPVEGIMKYEGPHKWREFLKYLQFRYPPARNALDVLPFHSELDFWRLIDNNRDQPRPVLAMFIENECSMCARQSNNFNTVATHYKDKIMAVEVNCAETEEAAKFCARHGSMEFGLPAYQLFDGVEVKTLPDGPRVNHDYAVWDAFLEANLPDVDYLEAIAQFDEKYKNKESVSDAKEKKRETEKTRTTTTATTTTESTKEAAVPASQQECPACKCEGGTGAAWALEKEMKKLVWAQLHVIDENAALGYLPKKSTVKVKELLEQQLELLGESQLPKTKGNK